MSVIINELEVAVQPPPPSGSDDGPAVATPTAGPTPMDLRETMRYLAERLDRVRAT